jgi:hypothetical protein
MVVVWGSAKRDQSLTHVNAPSSQSSLRLSTYQHTDTVSFFCSDTVASHSTQVGGLRDRYDCGFRFIHLAPPAHVSRLIADPNRAYLQEDRCQRSLPKAKPLPRSLEGREGVHLQLSLELSHA